MSDPRIIAIDIDGTSLASRSGDIEREKRVAIHDLLEGNRFAPAVADAGPYKVGMRCEEGRLAIDVADRKGAHLKSFVLAMTAFKRLIRDYFAICDSYFKAVRAASAHEIETVDMARRGVHNAAAELLQERLKDKIEMDFDTARRLFTLIAVLHARG